MKPTPDDAQPRRDGWFEHRGIWEEVVVGTVLASDKRTERWEVIDVAHGATQIRYGYTLWMRIREQTSGAEHTIEPRSKTLPVTILTQDPSDVTAGDPTAPSDFDAVMLIVDKLGATWMAHRDDRTGEVVCPQVLYIKDDQGLPNAHRGMIEHLHIAHATEVSDDLSVEDGILEHIAAHKRVGGFPHRHTPEDLTLFY